MSLNEQVNVVARGSSKKLVELYVWIFLAILVSGRGILEIATYQASPPEIITHRYFEFLASIIVILFPILFQLIFGALPFESLRNKRNLVRKSEKEIESTASKPFEVEESLMSMAFENMAEDHVIDQSAEKYLIRLAVESRSLAKSIFTRAGVYLMVGVLIAFSGLAFFYFQTIAFSEKADMTSYVVALLPKFGVLFFIEFIAIFFLKQYKSAMDEFRYYHSMQRTRDEAVAAFKLIKCDEIKVDAYEFVNKSGLSGTVGVLGNGETSEIVEARKLQEDELAVFSKIIEAISTKNGKGS